VYKDRDDGIGLMGLMGFDWIRLDSIGWDGIGWDWADGATAPHSAHGQHC
jgi:hypothetical protein